MGGDFFFEDFLGEVFSVNREVWRENFLSPLEEFKISLSQFIDDPSTSIASISDLDIYGSELKLKSDWLVKTLKLKRQLQMIPLSTGVNICKI